jgi:spoIIIJ-associated protein
LFQLAGKKHDAPRIFFDINNYRKDREKLITELARGAARKVAATKEHLELPSMNSYERRIVHVELAAHPDVRTESQGLGKERKVIIKPVE